MTDEMVDQSSVMVETQLFRRDDHYSPQWMERADPHRLRGEVERSVESLKRHMAEQKYAPIGGLGQIKIEWRLEVNVIAGKWPDDEAIQEALPFEEFVEMMERTSPYSPPPVLSRRTPDDDLADMVKAIDESERSGGPGWAHGKNTGQPSTSDTDSTSTEQ